MIRAHLAAGRRRLTLAAVLLTAVTSIGARPRAPGITFKMRMVATLPSMPGMNSQGDIVIVGHGVAAGNRSRIDIDSSAQGPFAVGDYMLTLDSGRVAIVSPSSKTYSNEFSLGGAMPSDIMSMASLTNVTVGVEKIAGTDTIEGRATEHYRIDAEYSLGIMGQNMSVSNVVDVWTAQLPATVKVAGGSPPPSMMTGPFAELSQKMVDAQKKLGTGSTIKTVNQTNLTGPMSMTLTQSMQITDIKPSDIDESQLRIPDGFTVRPPSL